jgi:hypothetical protein
MGPAKKLPIVNIETLVAGIAFAAKMISASFWFTTLN